MVEYLRGAISYTQHIESMEFVTTTRGIRSLIHQGYRYTLNRRTANGQIYWRCTDRSCPGRAVTDVHAQLAAGGLPRRRRRKYRNHENRLKIIEEKHEAGNYTLQELLRAYSHWVSL